MKPMLPSQTSTTKTKVPDEGGLAPLLDAWDLAHPGVADPDWRHLLDEMAHPGTTQAFHRLAEAVA